MSRSQKTSVGSTTEVEGAPSTEVLHLLHQDNPSDRGLRRLSKEECVSWSGTSEAFLSHRPGVQIPPCVPYSLMTCLQTLRLRRLEDLRDFLVRDLRDFLVDMKDFQPAI